MLLGYNTNGLAHHAPVDAIRLLAQLGYQSVAITVDHYALSPFDDRLASQQTSVSRALHDHGMRSVIETGARYLLDPMRKHQPTLLSAAAPDRQRRIDFLRHCIDLAVHLSSDAVSLWSGTPDEPLDDSAALDRLADSLRPVLDHAREAGVVLAFEPEPGMYVDTMARFERMLQWIDAPHLKLTLDVGHLYCQGEVPIVDYIQRWSDRTVNVHIEDMRAGVHEHLMFGEGEMNFPPIIEALINTGYQGGLHVELSRHSHCGPSAAQQAYNFLAPLVHHHQPQRKS